MDDLERKKNVFALAFFAVSNNSVVAFQLFQIGPRPKGRRRRLVLVFFRFLSSTAHKIPNKGKPGIEEALLVFSCSSEEGLECIFTTLQSMMNAKLR